MSSRNENRDLKQGRRRRVVKKMNLRSFKLNRVYLDPLNMSSAGDFSWRKENSSSNVHVLHKTAN